MSTYPRSPDQRPRGRGRPARISRDAIVDAALELGIETFSMQAVADRLGVTAPALYSHVTGRDEVVALAGAQVRRRLGTFTSDADDWRGWLRDFATNVRATMAGNASPLALDLHHPPPAELLAGEPGLRLLFEAGFEVVDAAYALWLVYRVAATAGPERTPSFAGFVADTGEVLRGGARRASAPATGAVQRALASGDHDTFAFDLEVVLDGLAARLPTSRPPATTATAPAGAGRRPRSRR